MTDSLPKKMVTRYSNWCAVTHGHEMMAKPDGSWVLFADYQIAIAELLTARLEIERLRAALERIAMNGQKGLPAFCKDHITGDAPKEVLTAFIMASSTLLCGFEMKVLVACEFSGVVRDAFILLGHSAVSCDLIASESPGPHIVGDVLGVLASEPWDLMIAHPPCTYLATSGARWMKDPIRLEKQKEAVAFAKAIWEAPIPMICMENPRSVLMTQIGRPHQQIHPWQFGHGERKETFLWLKNLPPLNVTDVVPGREARVHREAPGPERQKNRSRTLPGIAAAMAAQWGNFSVQTMMELKSPTASVRQTADACPLGGTDAAGGAVGIPSFEFNQSGNSHE